MSLSFNVPPLPPIIDLHVNLSRWPFRRLPDDEPALLVKRLRAHGVVRALASSFDGLLHLDLPAVNRRLVTECAQVAPGFLTPVGAINLTLPNWEADVAWCGRTPAVAGVRVWPGYHTVQWTDPRWDELAQLCVEHTLLLQIVMRLEDARTEHPRFQSQPMDLKPMPAWLSRHPQLRVVLINPGRDVPVTTAAELAAAGQVYFEIGMIEGTGGLATYLQKVPAERVVFGSHLPFFYIEAATLRLHESDLGEQILQMICQKNAERLLQRDRGALD